MPRVFGLLLILTRVPCDLRLFHGGRSDGFPDT